MRQLASMVAACLLSGPALARPALPSACAAFDLHIVTLIETVAAAEPTSLRLVEAAELLRRARAACRVDDADEAMRLYSVIDLRPPTRALQPILDLY
jgi:hypothetical protein